MYGPIVRAWLDTTALPAVRLALDLTDALERERALEERAVSALASRSLPRQIQVFVATTDGRNEIHSGGCVDITDDGALTIYAGEVIDPDTVVKSYGPGEVASYVTRLPGDAAPIEGGPIEPPSDPCGNGPLRTGETNGDQR